MKLVLSILGIVATCIALVVSAPFWLYLMAFNHFFNENDLSNTV
jgi:hypothetical protein